jgi:allophanate hydrolase
VTTPGTIADLHQRYAGGLNPAEAVAEAYRRIEAAGDPGIFISLVPRHEAIATARALGPFDPRSKPLWGVPFAIKDNIDLAGLPTTAACPAYAYRPEESAPAVARLIAAGAIPIGKTNLDQFATGLVGLRTPYPPPLNPFDPGIVPGGSGSAVAVARGIVPFALGTDTAGSGRVPAGLNNIVGLKPTKGAISTRGVVPACRTLDCVSVFARNVEDASRIFQTIAAFDPADPFSRPIEAQPSIPNPRIGIPDRASRRFFGDVLSERAFDAALDALDALDGAGGLGLTLVETDLVVLLETGALVYGGPWVAERHLAVGDFIARHPDAVHPVVGKIIADAARLSAADAFAGLYRLAELRRAAEPIWRAVDMLIVPTLPRPRPIADLLADPITPNAELGTYTNFVNLLDLCALAIPGPTRADGFPSSITLVAPAHRDDPVAALGTALHARIGPQPGFALN